METQKLVIEEARCPCPLSGILSKNTKTYAQELEWEESTKTEQDCYISALKSLGKIGFDIKCLSRKKVGAVTIHRADAMSAFGVAAYIESMDRVKNSVQNAQRMLSSLEKDDKDRKDLVMEVKEGN